LLRTVADTVVEDKVGSEIEAEADGSTTAEELGEGTTLAAEEGCTEGLSSAG